MQGPVLSAKVWYVYINLEVCEHYLKYYGNGTGNGLENDETAKKVALIVRKFQEVSGVPVSQYLQKGYPVITALRYVDNVGNDKVKIVLYDRKMRPVKPK
jgi:hypothetical protein